MAKDTKNLLQEVEKLFQGVEEGKIAISAFIQDLKEKYPQKRVVKAPLEKFLEEFSQIINNIGEIDKNKFHLYDKIYFQLKQAGFVKKGAVNEDLIGKIKIGKPLELGKGQTFLSRISRKDEMYSLIKKDSEGKKLTKKEIDMLVDFLNESNNENENLSYFVSMKTKESKNWDEIVSRILTNSPKRQKILLQDRDAASMLSDMLKGKISNKQFFEEIKLLKKVKPDDFDQLIGLSEEFFSMSSKTQEKIKKKNNGRYNQAMEAIKDCRYGDKRKRVSRKTEEDTITAKGPAEGTTVHEYFDDVKSESGVDIRSVPQEEHVVSYDRYFTENKKVMRMPTNFADIFVFVFQNKISLGKELRMVLEYAGIQDPIKSKKAGRFIGLMKKVISPSNNLTEKEIAEAVRGSLGAGKNSDILARILIDQSKMARTQKIKLAEWQNGIIEAYKTAKVSIEEVRKAIKGEEKEYLKLTPSQKADYLIGKTQKGKPLEYYVEKDTPQTTRQIVEELSGEKRQLTASQQGIVSREAFKELNNMSVSGTTSASDTRELTRRLISLVQNQWVSGKKYSIARILGQYDQEVVDSVREAFEKISKKSYIKKSQATKDFVSEIMSSFTELKSKDREEAPVSYADIKRMKTSPESVKFSASTIKDLWITEMTSEAEDKSSKQSVEYLRQRQNRAISLKSELDYLKRTAPTSRRIKQIEKEISELTMQEERGAETPVLSNRTTQGIAYHLLREILNSLELGVPEKAGFNQMDYEIFRKDPKVFLDKMVASMTANPQKWLKEHGGMTGELAGFFTVATDEKNNKVIKIAKEVKNIVNGVYESYRSSSEGIIYFEKTATGKHEKRIKKSRLVKSEWGDTMEIEDGRGGVIRVSGVFDEIFEDDKGQLWYRDYKARAESERPFEELTQGYAGVLYIKKNFPHKKIGGIVLEHIDPNTGKMAQIVYPYSEGVEKEFISLLRIRALEERKLITKEESEALLPETFQKSLEVEDEKAEARIASVPEADIKRIKEQFKSVFTSKSAPEVTITKYEEAEPLSTSGTAQAVKTVLADHFRGTGYSFVYSKEQEKILADAKKSGGKVVETSASSFKAPWINLPEGISELLNERQSRAVDLRKHLSTLISGTGIYKDTLRDLIRYSAQVQFGSTSGSMKKMETNFANATVRGTAYHALREIFGRMEMGDFSDVKGFSRLDYAEFEKNPEKYAEELISFIKADPVGWLLRHGGFDNELVGLFTYFGEDKKSVFGIKLGLTKQSMNLIRSLAQSKKLFGEGIKSPTGEIITRNKIVGVEVGGGSLIRLKKSNFVVYGGQYDEFFEDSQGRIWYRDYKARAESERPFEELTQAYSAFLYLSQTYPGKTIGGAIFEHVVPGTGKINYKMLNFSGQMMRDFLKAADLYGQTILREISPEQAMAAMPSAFREAFRKQVASKVVIDKDTGQGIYFSPSREAATPGHPRIARSVAFERPKKGYSAELYNVLVKTLGFSGYTLTEEDIQRLGIRERKDIYAEEAARIFGTYGAEGLAVGRPLIEALRSGDAKIISEEMRKYQEEVRRGSASSAEWINVSVPLSTSLLSKYMKEEGGVRTLFDRRITWTKQGWKYTDEKGAAVSAPITNVQLNLTKILEKYTENRDYSNPYIQEVVRFLKSIPELDRIASLPDNEIEDMKDESGKVLFSRDDLLSAKKMLWIIRGKAKQWPKEGMEKNPASDILAAIGLGERPGKEGKRMLTDMAFRNAMKGEFLFLRGSEFRRRPAGASLELELFKMKEEEGDFLPYYVEKQIKAIEKNIIERYKRVYSVNWNFNYFSPRNPSLNLEGKVLVQLIYAIEKQLEEIGVIKGNETIVKPGLTPWNSLKTQVKVDKSLLEEIELPDELKEILEQRIENLEQYEKKLEQYNDGLGDEEIRLYRHNIYGNINKLARLHSLKKGDNSEREPKGIKQDLALMGDVFKNHYVFFQITKPGIKKDIPIGEIETVSDWSASTLKASSDFLDNLHSSYLLGENVSPYYSFKDLEFFTKGVRSLPKSIDTGYYFTSYEKEIYEEMKKILGPAINWKDILKFTREHSVEEIEKKYPRLYDYMSRGIDFQGERRAGINEVEQEAQKRVMQPETEGIAPVSAAQLWGSYNTLKENVKNSPELISDIFSGEYDRRQAAIGFIRTSFPFLPGEFRFSDLGDEAADAAHNIFEDFVKVLSNPDFGLSQNQVEYIANILRRTLHAPEEHATDTAAFLGAATAKMLYFGGEFFRTLTELSPTQLRAMVFAQELMNDMLLLQKENPNLSDGELLHMAMQKYISEMIEDRSHGDYESFAEKYGEDAANLVSRYMRIGNFESEEQKTFIRNLGIAFKAKTSKGEAFAFFGGKDKSGKTAYQVMMEEGVGPLNIRMWEGIWVTDKFGSRRYEKKVKNVAFGKTSDGTTLEDFLTGKGRSEFISGDWETENPSRTRKQGKEDGSGMADEEKAQQVVTLEDGTKSFYIEQGPTTITVNGEIKLNGDVSVGDGQGSYGGSSGGSYGGGSSRYGGPGRGRYERRGTWRRSDYSSESSSENLAAQERRLQTLKEGSVGDVLGTSFGGYFNRLSSYGIAYRMISTAVRTITNLINQAKELDKTLSNLRVVTGYNKEEATNLMQSYSRLGEELSATTNEVATAANDWLRQGYSVTEVNDLITASLHLSKLGMIESGQATSYLTSMLKGFKLEASDAMNVVDKLTKVDMAAATSAGDIAESLRQFAVSAQMSGVDIDQAIAMATTIMDVSQRDASSVGNALKTMIARYGNVKAGKYSAMTTDGDKGDTGEALNDIEKVLSKVGIRMRETNLEFRDFDDILEELADKWSTIDDVSRNAIATALAGKKVLCQNI